MATDSEISDICLEHRLLLRHHTHKVVSKPPEMMMFSGSELCPSRLSMNSAMLSWTCGIPVGVEEYEPVIEYIRIHSTALRVGVRMEKIPQTMNLYKKVLFTHTPSTTDPQKPLCSLPGIQRKAFFFK